MTELHIAASMIGMRRLEATEIAAVVERHGLTKDWLRSRLQLADEQGWMDEKGLEAVSALLEIMEMVDSAKA